MTTSTIADIPFIDLTGLTGGSHGKRRAIAQDIAAACREHGFFYLANHGVAQQQVDRMFELAEAFFCLPKSSKAAVAVARRRDFRGYLPGKTKGDAADIKANMQQAFQIYAELPADDPDILAGTPMHGANPWPNDLPHLKPEMLGYFDVMSDLGALLLELCAEGLDLPSETFASRFQKPMNWLRLLRYPPQGETSVEEAIGTRAHTDSSALTILALDDVAGLQVCTTQGDWITIRRIPGTFVVNTGEIMKLFTDGVYQSAFHRVINWTGRERFSVPFFVTPSFHEVLRPLMVNPDRDNIGPDLHPVLKTGSEIRCGDFLMEQYSRIYPSA
jgi:isopenicillin N synthase-like dioxygenase